MLSINFKYQGKKVEKKAIKTDWSDLTFGCLLKLFDNVSIEDEAKRIDANLLILSEMDESEIAHLDYETIEAIKPWIAFIDNVDALKCESLQAKIASINIGAEAWGKFEAARTAIQSCADKSIMPAMPTIVATYVEGADLLAMKLPKAYPIAMHFVDQLNTFNSKYSRLNDYKPSSKELSAGVEKLNQYGFFTTLHALSKGDPLKYDEMLELQADNVYQTLVLDFELSEIQKKYSENNEKAK